MTEYGIQEPEPGAVIGHNVICNAWIDPRGRVYYVPMYGHRAVAINVLNRDPEAMEDQGWIHLSIADPGYVIIINPRAITYSQRETMWDLRATAEAELESRPYSGNVKRFYRAVMMFFEEYGE